jgi:hypothetical protein
MRSTVVSRPSASMSSWAYETIRLATKSLHIFFVNRADLYPLAAPRIATAANDFRASTRKVKLPD